MDAKFKMFIKRFVLFSTPLIITLIVLDFIVISTGELTPVKTVINKQLENQGIVLFGRRVVDQELRKYKYELMNSTEPQVYAIGSSRILSFREEFFNPYYSFINLGSIAHNLGDVRDLVERMPSASTTKIVLLSLDYYWFGQKRPIGSDLTGDLRMSDVIIDWRAHIYSMRYILNLIFTDFRRFNNLFYKDNIFVKSFGIQGREGNGYRKDGSYLYTNILNELRDNNVYRDREQPPIIDRIKEGSTGSYVFDNDFDGNRILVLDELLKLFKDKNYYVIGIGLPFSSEVFIELNNNEHHRNLFNEFQTKIPIVFKANNLHFFDYSDLKSVGLSDIYMFDGVHPSETASAVIFSDLLKRINNKLIIDRDKLLDQINRFIDSKNTTSYELDFS